MELGQAVTLKLVRWCEYDMIDVVGLSVPEALGQFRACAVGR
jgi:hypothetical protein